MKKISILLVDDHKLFRETLISMLTRDKRFEMVGETSNTDLALAIAIEKAPDIILMDINMSPIDGFELTEKILAQAPDSKVVAITMHAMPAFARRMVQLGAKAYVTKNSSLRELLICIEEVNAGKKYICEEIRNILVTQDLEKGQSGPDLNVLSERELLIVRLIKNGLSSRDIGSQLELATKTIETHRYNILKKLNLKNTVALINFTNFHGL